VPLVLLPLVLLNLAQTSTSFLHVLGAASAMWRVILDAHSTQLQRWEGIRYERALLARPARPR
jgi:uncharacterized membrane protein YecN with MAPEG domain